MSTRPSWLSFAIVIHVRQDDDDWILRGTSAAQLIRPHLRFQIVHGFHVTSLEIDKRNALLVDSERWIRVALTKIT